MIAVLISIFCYFSTIIPYNPKNIVRFTWDLGQTSDPIFLVELDVLYRIVPKNHMVIYVKFRDIWPQRLHWFIMGKIHFALFYLNYFLLRNETTIIRSLLLPSIFSVKISKIDISVHEILSLKYMAKSVNARLTRKLTSNWDKILIR